MTAAAQRTLAFDDRRPAAERFADFDAAYPQVYEAFVRFAEELRQKSDHGSARLIGERIRWEVWTGSVDGNGLKVNDAFWPYYARKLAAEQPHRFGSFFEFRRRER